MNSASDMNSAVQAIKGAILRAQSQAAQHVNAVQLSLYYGIGKYVSQNSRNGYWGTGAISTISALLQKELPGLRGFSVRNLRNMRFFYEQWNTTLFRSPVATESENSNVPINDWNIDELLLVKLNRSPLATDLQAGDFLSISFTHHMEILHQTSSLPERIFYVNQAALHHWNKYTLRRYLQEDLYHHQGILPNNFAETMSDAHKSLQAINMFKDEYLLDFINVEELTLPGKDVDERVVEKEIVRHIRDFILEFGKDFIFMGEQYRVELEGEEMFIDLLFYCRELACMVAVELKKGKFKPAYLGQLDAYLQALDLTMKKDHENPSIGIVLCKEMNKSFVDVIVRNYDNPMGVATYRTKDDMPERLRDALPDVDEMRKLLNSKDDGSLT